jgi:hypothetical protein
LLQLIQTRILSVVAWYHLAFFAISMAMFGLTAGAIWVYKGGKRFNADSLGRDLSYYSGLFALTVVICFAVQMSLALQSPDINTSVSNIWAWLMLALCMSIPFFFSGVAVSLALTRSPYPIGRVYGVDLAGAAIGCLGVLWLLNNTDGPSAILWVAAVAAIGAWVFPGNPADTPDGNSLRLSKAIGYQAPLVIVLIVAAYANGMGHMGLQPLMVKDQAETADKYIFREWNSFSRIAVAPPLTLRKPYLWGPSPLLPEAYQSAQAFMNIDGNAGSAAFEFDGDFERVNFLKYDVTNLAYFLPNRSKSAVIGVGGGRDILSAAMLGMTDITAVELNPIFVELLTENEGMRDFSQISQIPGVKFVIDEGRSWFARTEDRFQIIQMSMIDTWAATGAGAFTLSENGLYTVEAWKTFMSRLTPDGVFTVSRWYSPGNVDETGRMISLAVATLMEMGVSNPRNHIFLVSQDNKVATLVMGLAPLSAVDVAALTKASADLQHPILLSPNQLSDSDTLNSIVSSRDMTELETITSGMALDLTPPRDNRPFFFNQLPLNKPLQAIRTARRMSQSQDAEGGVVSGNLAATMTLMMLFVLSTILVIVTIIVPIRSAVRDVGTALAAGGTLYFLFIGIGFMMVEIGLLQRTSVFLGHPIYSLSVLLFTLILSAGIGSLLSDLFALTTRARFTGWAILTGAYILALPVWAPQFMSGFEDGSLLLRAMICISIIAPAGLLMGYGFPTGIAITSAIDDRPTPWFWGINGAAGVLASIVAVATSIANGISATLTVGAICYLILIPITLTLLWPGYEKATKS